MTAADEALSPVERENRYLKQRVAQLQSDVGDLNSEIDRLRQQLEHAGARREQRAPNPLGGGQ